MTDSETTNWGGAEVDRVDMPKIIRNTSTPENEKFWQAVVKNAKEVDGWPEWKKGWVRAVPKVDA